MDLSNRRAENRSKSKRGEPDISGSVGPRRITGREGMTNRDRMKSAAHESKKNRAQQALLFAKNAAPQT